MYFYDDLMNSKKQLVCLIDNNSNALKVSYCSSLFLVTHWEKAILGTHNAKRDDYILQPIPIVKEQEIQFWHPLNAKLYKNNPEILKKNPKKYPQKKQKGKTRLSTWSN